LDEERIENSDESNGDDEKSSPESRVHRRFSKPVEQKYKIVHAESTRHLKILIYLFLYLDLKVNNLKKLMWKKLAVL
jgi:hypothetical protein